jgi:hypothetical protein
VEAGSRQPVEPSRTGIPPRLADVHAGQTWSRMAYRVPLLFNTGRAPRCATKSTADHDAKGVAMLVQTTCCAALLARNCASAQDEGWQ